MVNKSLEADGCMLNKTVPVFWFTKVLFRKLVFGGNFRFRRFLNSGKFFFPRGRAISSKLNLRLNKFAQRITVFDQPICVNQTGFHVGWVVDDFGKKRLV